MSRGTCAELLPVLRERYERRGREARRGMLDDFCEQFGYSRKHAIKVLGAKLPAPSGRPKPGPPREYGEDVQRVVKELWLASDQLCGKRLAPALALWLPFYERREGRLRRKVLAISPATLDRLLAPARAAQPRRGLCGTKPGSLLRTQIPIHNEAWDVSQPGCGCPERSRRGWRRTPWRTAGAAWRVICQRPPALPFGLPAAGCLAPPGSSGA